MLKRLKRRSLLLAHWYWREFSAAFINEAEGVNFYTYTHILLFSFSARTHIFKFFILHTDFNFYYTVHAKPHPSRYTGSAWPDTGTANQITITVNSSSTVASVSNRSPLLIITVHFVVPDQIGRTDRCVRNERGSSGSASAHRNRPHRRWWRRQWDHSSLAKERRIKQTCT